MEAQSPVSGFLHEPLSQQAQQAIFIPWIQASLAASIPFLTRLNRAHLVAIRRAGLISAPEAATLDRAILQIEAEGPAKLVIDGSLEDVYFNYEARLLAIAGKDTGSRLHVARSRNDLQSTLDRMRARALGQELASALLDLRGVLLEQAARNLDCVMPGYTHMQHAQPITFGFYLLGIERSLERDTRRTLAALEHINQCPLGAGALAGTPYPIDRAHTASLLGFAAPVPHALDAVASKDAIMELLTATLFATTTVGRLAQDFYLMTTYEFGMLDLPDNLAITSSLMPQKKNQAVLEFLKGRQSHLIGAMTTAFSAFHAKPFSHVLDGNADSLQFLWDALLGVAGLLPVAGSVVAGVRPRRQRMRELADANYATATDFADYLVMRHGLAFKEAHHVTGRVVRLALDDGISPTDIKAPLVARAAREILGRELRLGNEEIRAAFDSGQSLQRRRGSGGPAIEDATALHARALRELADTRRELETFQAMVSNADTQLQAETAAL
ncbi:argininosuccinate lyase [Pigmentiphaga sp. H8]|uniref:argininosuccinate lyase n=1 Tax=Pigmentiphaga sp. H8 TaxID=2488560 RepID=UPI000F596320|nr:argininosuccinate lyase [Pigmentiphaga sp. H8]AZG10564.1 argininosuccinate lyase [Pigmentiphaga sp. H8]